MIAETLNLSLRETTHSIVNCPRETLKIQRSTIHEHIWIDNLGVIEIWTLKPRSTILNYWGSVLRRYVRGWFSVSGRGLGPGGRAGGGEGRRGAVGRVVPAVVGRGRQQRGLLLAHDHRALVDGLGVPSLLEFILEYDGDALGAEGLPFLLVADAHFACKRNCCCYM